MAPSSPDAGPSCAGSDEGAQGPEEESAGASRAAPATQSTRKDPLARKASKPVEFLLEKDTKKEPIIQNALLKVVSRKYWQPLPKILRRASECMELVFGLELKKIISHASKVILKNLQVRLQQYMNHEPPDVQAGFGKGRGTRDQIANIRWIMEKAKEFQKNIYF